MMLHLHPRIHEMKRGWEGKQINLTPEICVEHGTYMYFSRIHVHIIAYCTIDKCACWFGHTCVQCVACKMQLIWMSTIYVKDVIDIRHSNWNCTFKHLLACHPFSYSQEARNLCHPHISHRAISVPSPTVCQSCACFGCQSKAKRLPYTVISFVSRCMYAKTCF